MVHGFTIQGQPLVLDVESGSLHAVDEAAYGLINEIQEQTQNGMSLHESLRTAAEKTNENEALDEIKSLIDARQLFAPAHAAHSVVRREPTVKALCLHIAHACNLRCAYCFAGQGAYGGEHGLMSVETGQKAIDFLITHSGGRRSLEVDFFGGEPMLGWDVVKEIVRYARRREKETDKRFRFTLTTNGLLLTDEDHAFINEEMDNVVLSIDGRPPVHDRMRKRLDGAGSYAEVLPRLLRMAESRGQRQYYVRGTYTRFNLDFAQDVLHLADAGFNRISVEPVVTDPSREYAIRPEDVPGLCREYEKLAAALFARERAGRPVLFFHFEIDLEGGPCLAKRSTGCGAGAEYLAVTPEGNLFPCHQFVNESSFYTGNVYEGITAPEVGVAFARCNVYAKPECGACFARYYCGGGCAANAFHTNGDILSPDAIACALQRKRVECALWLYFKRNASQG